VVTREFLIPVLSEIYEGNVSDGKMFLPTLTRLRNKLSELHLDIQELTVVFDKGSDSKGNFADLDLLEVPYVASLTPSYHEDLINVPLDSYHLEQVNEHQLMCYRTQKEVWGKTRTIVLFISEKLRQGQLRGLAQAISETITIHSLSSKPVRETQLEEIDPALQRLYGNW